RTAGCAETSVAAASSSAANRLCRPMVFILLQTKTGASRRPLTSHLPTSERVAEADGSLQDVAAASRAPRRPVVVARRRAVVHFRRDGVDERLPVEAIASAERDL